MNAKVILVLIILVVLAAGGVYLVTQRPAGIGQPAPRELPESIAPQIADRSAEATRIEITNPGERVTLTRGFEEAKAENGWTVDQLDGYPADVSRIREMFIALAELEPVEFKTRDPENFERLRLGLPTVDADAFQEGVNAPKRVRVLTRDGDALADVILGKEEIGTGPPELFVRRAREDQSYLAEGRVDPSVEPTQWIDRAPVRVSRSDVERVEVTTPEGDTYTIVREEAEGETGSPSFRLEEIPEGKELASPGIAGSVAGALSFLNVEDVSKTFDLPDDVARGTVVFTKTDDMTLTVTVADRSEEGDLPRWATFEAAGEGAGEINGTVDGWAYQLPRSVARNLQRPLDDLLTDAEPADVSEDVSEDGSGNESDDGGGNDDAG